MGFFRRSDAEQQEWLRKQFVKQYSEGVETAFGSFERSFNLSKIQLQQQEIKDGIYAWLNALIMISAYGMGKERSAKAMGYLQFITEKTHTEGEVSSVEDFRTMSVRAGLALTDARNKAENDPSGMVVPSLTFINAIPGLKAIAPKDIMLYIDYMPQIELIVLKSFRLWFDSFIKG